MSDSEILDSRGGIITLKGPAAQGTTQNLFSQSFISTPPNDGQPSQPAAYGLAPTVPHVAIPNHLDSDSTRHLEVQRTITSYDDLNHGESNLYPHIYNQPASNYGFNSEPAGLQRAQQVPPTYHPHANPTHCPLGSHEGTQYRVESNMFNAWNSLGLDVSDAHQHDYPWQNGPAMPMLEHAQTNAPYTLTSAQSSMYSGLSNPPTSTDVTQASSSFSNLGNRRPAQKYTCHFAGCKTTVPFSSKSTLQRHQNEQHFFDSGNLFSCRGQRFGCPYSSARSFTVNRHEATCGHLKSWEDLSRLRPSPYIVSITQPSPPRPPPSTNFQQLDHMMAQQETSLLASQHNAQQELSRAEARRLKAQRWLFALNSEHGDAPPEITLPFISYLKEQEEEASTVISRMQEAFNITNNVDT